MHENTPGYGFGRLFREKSGYDFANTPVRGKRSIKGSLSFFGYNVGSEKLCVEDGGRRSGSGDGSGGSGGDGCYRRN